MKLSKRQQESGDIILNNFRDEITYFPFMKKLSRKEQEIEARRAADPIAQAIGREDIDYSSDELPTAPRFADGQKPIATMNFIDVPFEAAHEAKYPAIVLEELLAADEITFEQYERLQRENK